ncbi:DUF493 domain-containing protein [Pseudoxanthomonas sp. SGD-10]|nr:DUF493 domain-containing protein [Pseudoxanthomonas sp. SGD-10]
MEDQNKKINFRAIDDKQAGQDFYTNFKERLEQVEKFPAEYNFKFIVANQPAKIEELKEIFTNLPVRLSASKNGKYVSLTISKYVQNADEVITYYKKAAQVEGVMML